MACFRPPPCAPQLFRRQGPHCRPARGPGPAGCRPTGCLTSTAGNLLNFPKTMKGNHLRLRVPRGSIPMGDAREPCRAPLAGCCTQWAHRHTPAALPPGQRGELRDGALSVVKQERTRAESLERLVAFWRTGLGLTGVHTSSHHLSSN